MEEENLFLIIGHEDYAFFKNLDLSHFKWCPSLPDIDIKCPEQTYRSRPVQDKKSTEHKEEDRQNLHNEKKRGNVLDQEKKNQGNTIPLRFDQFLMRINWNQYQNYTQSI